MAFLASLAPSCLAADGMSGLGAAFKPQIVADAPAATAATRPAGPSAGVQVLVTSATRSVAAIDNQIVRVGDLIHGMRVARIDHNGVLLTGEAGAREMLAVNPGVMKSKRQAQAGTAGLPAAPGVGASAPPRAAAKVSNGVRQ